MESNYNMATIFTKKDFNFPCIYKLTSPSGKIYIGQTQCLYRRFRDYRKPEANEYLMNAILKYGLENISVEILEKDLLLDELDEREQFYLDTFKNKEEAIKHRLDYELNNNIKNKYNEFSNL